MNLHIQAIATVLSLMNPAICGIMFGGNEADRSRDERLADAVMTLAVSHSGSHIPGSAMIAVGWQRLLHGSSW